MKSNIKNDMGYTLQYLDDKARCPFCETVTHHHWHFGTRGDRRSSGGHYYEIDIEFSICSLCNSRTIWKDEKMIYPDIALVPSPNEDLPEEIKMEYYEAASVFSKSPKSSAALLRLALQKLCKHLGEKGDNINTDIKSLVAKGLPVTIQKAMDSIRVVGNNAVHPGEINPNDNPEVAAMLFKCINLIAQTMITQPREIDEVFGKLPEGSREAIKKRDTN